MHLPSAWWYRSSDPFGRPGCRTDWFLSCSVRNLLIYWATYRDPWRFPKAFRGNCNTISVPETCSKWGAENGFNALGFFFFFFHFISGSCHENDVSHVQPRMLKNKEIAAWLLDLAPAWIQGNNILIKVELSEGKSIHLKNKKKWIQGQSAT